MGHQPGTDQDAVIDSLRRKLEDYERWFGVLDSQMRVLERERQKLSAVMNHTDAGFLVLDPSLNVVWANDVFTLRFLGAASHHAPVPRMSCNQALCRRDTICEACPASVPFRSGAVAHAEIGLTLEGQERHIYVTAMPILSPEGKVDQTVLMLQDISDLTILRSSQEALRASEERFRLIFETAGAGMCTISPDGAFLQVNPAMCRFLGYSEEEMVSLSIFDVTDPEDLETTRRMLERGRAGLLQDTDYEKRYIRKDGAVVWGRVTANWLRDGELRATLAVSLVQDVTERKRLEQELRHAEKMSAVGLLVSGVAHELNNPLAGVVGFAQLLLKTDTEEKVRRGLERINQEAERCKKIVQNLQTFARKHKPQAEYVGINGIVESTLELRAYELQVDGIRVVSDLEPSLSRTMADFHQMRQVLLNIIINAHQAMAGRGGEGVLTLRTRGRDATILIEIEDNGPGIAEENLNRLFDPFFTTKDVGQGTGLGLSICYGIVKEHQGRVWARNAPGGGAVFTVELPIRGPAPGSEMPAPEVERPGPSSGRRGNILVVDDEASIVEILYEILKADGHRVDTAPNGRVAMRKIESQTYDLIISDLKMPGMSGQDLYRKIQELKPEMSARVIFATGDVVGAGTQDFLERVGNPCLQKPFEIDTLRQIVNAALSASSS